MDWNALAQLAKYMPFYFAEVAKHPTVSSWVQQSAASYPTVEVAQVITDAQTNAAALTPAPGASLEEDLARYAPFLFTEMFKHPTVAPWLAKTIAAMPSQEVAQIINDAQLNARALAT